MSPRKYVIIGGGACGPKTAARARRLDTEAKITMIQDEALISYAGCGIPYYISGEVKSRRELLVRSVNAFKKIYNVDVLINTRVDSIDRSAHRINVTDLKDGNTYSIDYDKLVIATGAYPVVPPLEGINLKGVHVVKRIPDADEIIQLINESTSKKAVIVGAGLIGVEMSEALTARGFEVTVVEALDRVLPGILDPEISDILAKHMQSKGVTLRLNQKITRFEGIDGRLQGAITDGEKIPADIAIVAIGVRPDSKLAKSAGLEIGRYGDIEVNEYLQTSDPDIYAGGDCVANVNLITGEKVFVPMGSTANKHGRVIAANIIGGKLKFPGIVSTACVKVFDFNVGRVGLGEKQAAEAGFNAVSAMIPGPDKPGYYPGSSEIIIKLIMDTKTHRIIGGQGIGPGDVIKRIDVLATGITMGITAEMLADIDLAYAPPYNNAMDVIHHTASLILNKLEGRTQGVKPSEVKEKLDKKEDFVLLDVRSKPEWDSVRIESPQTVFLPQPSLLDEKDKLPQDKEIITLCLRGVRAYQCACLLKGNGFKDVKFMEGSLMCWCDELWGEPVL